jgi:hypothetical protein
MWSTLHYTTLQWVTSREGINKRIPKKILNGKFHNKRGCRKTKNKMGVRCPEGRTTDARNMRMEEEIGWGKRRMEVLSKGGQGPEVAVASYIGGAYVDHLFGFYF